MNKLFDIKDIFLDWGHCFGRRDGAGAGRRAV